MGEATPLKLKRPATFDHLRSKSRPERIVEIHLDLDAVREVERLEGELDAKDLKPAAKAALLKSLTKAQAKVEETTVELLMRAVGSKAYDALILKHPATDEQNEESQETTGRPASYNADTFPAALIAASLVEPKLTEAEVREITDEWTSGEVARLWVVALQVNSQSELVNLGKASHGIRG
jgi:hypothetical protein